MVVFLVVDTGKTQPDDVCWLVVRRLLVPAYPKGALIKKQSFDLVSCSPLAAGKESIYLPSFGRFPPTQSTEIPRIPWWISPTTQQQCGIEFLVWWIDLERKLSYGLPPQLSDGGYARLVRENLNNSLNIDDYQKALDRELFDIQVMELKSSLQELLFNRGNRARINKHS